MHRINTRWILPHYVFFLNIVCGWIHGDALIWTHECIHVSCTAHRLIKTPDSQSSFSLSVSPSNMLYVQSIFNVICPQVCVKFGIILCLCKQDLCLIWFNTKSIWISKLFACFFLQIMEYFNLQTHLGGLLIDDYFSTFPTWPQQMINSWTSEWVK